MRKSETRVCAICGVTFDTINARKKYCSWNCSQESQRDRSRRLMRTRERSQRNTGSCQVCDFDLTVDLHHEGYRETYLLCPNHHALITRGIKTISELLIM